ncbi:MAG: 5,6-dimethylbenzimidazole synthase [Pseudomonadota bacterium]
MATKTAKEAAALAADCEAPGVFDPDLPEALVRLMRLRRDVRRFRPGAVPEPVLARCLEAFRLAPSVGLSEPWRLVRIDSAAARAAVIANVEAANAEALAGYHGERAALYATLKLHGCREAPVQIAVFCDEATAKGRGLGAATMPEMRRYSVVAAIQNFWLAARAEGVGVGWVSILDPARLAADLAVPADWVLIGYLCIGWPAEEGEIPELERAGWEARRPALEVLTR